MGWTTWCVMSGRASAMSLPVFARMPWWSSQFRSVYLTSPSLPPFPFAPLVTLYASKQACSSTTNSLRWDDATPPFGTWACTGSMDGFAGAILRVLDAGRGRVGRCGLCSVGSICIVCFSERSEPDDVLPLRRFSSTGVDFGRGGGVSSTSGSSSVFLSSLTAGAAVEPEWRRRRAGTTSGAMADMLEEMKHVGAHSVKIHSRSHNHFLIHSHRSSIDNQRQQ